MEVNPKTEFRGFENCEDITKDILAPFEFPILDGAEAAKLDEYSIHEKNINSRLLMGWAGYAMFLSLFHEIWMINSTHIHILAGTGNNGGDGYVLAWHILSSTNKNVTIWQLSNPVSDDAKYFFGLCNSVKSIKPLFINSIYDIDLKNVSIKSGDIVVDAVFGTGLNKPPSESLQIIFHKINSLKNIIRVSVDIPSGVYSNGDIFNHTVFRADYTYSFGSYKIGHLLEPGILNCGKLAILPIGFYPVDLVSDPYKLFKIGNSKRSIIRSYEIPPLRKQHGHKYDSGIISILGGSSGMEGAAIMSARSFLSLGGGLAKIYSNADSMKNTLLEQPECMIQSFSNQTSLEDAYVDSIIAKPENNVAVIGVGLQESLSQSFWARLLEIPDLNVIIDGSGLGQLAQSENLFKGHKLKNLILTPHKAEAEKLLEKNITNIRLASLEISEKFNASVYIKGPGGILILRTNNSLGEVYLMSKHYELSTGGTGDVLCGVIANMLLRMRSVYGVEAALKVYLNTAGRVVQNNFKNPDFLVPSEIIQSLRSAICDPQ